MSARRLPIPLLLAALAVVGATAAWWVLDELARAQRRIELAPGSAAAAEPRGTAAIEPSLRVAREATRAPAAAPRVEPLPIFPIARAKADLAVVVIDETGRSTSDVVVELRSTAGGYRPGLDVGDDRSIALERTTGRDGRALFADVPLGPYEALGRAPDGRRGSVDFAFRAAAGAPDVTLPLFEIGSGIELAVEVIDEQERPIAGAHVEATGDRVDHGPIGGEGAPALAGVTGADGRLLFAGIVVDRAVLVARAPDGRIGCNLAPHPLLETKEFDAQRRWWQRVVVGPPARLVVRAVGVDPALLLGATLFADLRTSEHPHEWSWGTAVAALPPTSNGLFRFESLPEGRVALRLDSPRGVRLVAEPIDFGGPLENSARPPVVPLATGEEREIELRVALGATIRGRVRTSDGRPVAGAVVTALLAPATSNFPDGFVLRGVNVWRFDGEVGRESLHPFGHPRARTDANGDYALTGLQPGRHRVEVRAPRLSFDRREGVVAADSAVVALDHELEPAGVLQGVSNAEGYLGVTRAGEPLPFAIAILPGSRAFTFAGLPAGEWVLSQFHSDGSVAPVELARATVVAGRTTWIDLTEVPGPHAIRGRLVDARGPVAGARVGFVDLAATTDELGRFVVPRAFPSTGRFPLHVTFGGVHYVRPVDSGDGHAELSDVELRLGEEELVLVTTSADGGALEGWLSLSGGGLLLGDDEPRVASARLPIGASGRLVVGRLDPGEYSVEATWSNGAVRRERVKLPRAEPLDVSPPPIGEVEVVVRDVEGRPVPFREIWLATWLGAGELPPDQEAVGHEELFDWKEGHADAAGRFVAPAVRAGAGIVHVDRMVDGETETVATRRFVLLAGARVRVELVVDRR